MSMKLLSLACARALRDGGIDAMAALDASLKIALEFASVEDHAEIKLAIGHAMSAIMDATTLPAAKAFPQLDPSDEEWRAAAKSRILARAAFFIEEF